MQVISLGAYKQFHTVCGDAILPESTAKFRSNVALTGCLFIQAMSSIGRPLELLMVDVGFVSAEHFQF
jgi:hypothetical protein